MISSRLGAALALLIAVAALGMAVGAFFAAVAGDDDDRPVLVQTRLTNEYGGSPQLFALHDFYAGAGSDGRLHAFYVYAPGFTGHVRGCRILWDPDATIPDDDSVGPGLYVDPCGSSRWDRDGELVAGEGERDLDEFPTQAGVEGVVVDTSRLLCGDAVAPAASPTPSGRTPTPTPDGPQECERVESSVP